MKKPGQVALVPFPQVDLTPGKPRPVLLLACVPGPYDDWDARLFLAFALQVALRGEEETIPAT